MEKSNWAKGRTPTQLIRIDMETYERAKEAAREDKMSLRAWMHQVIEAILLTRRKNE